MPVKNEARYHTTPVLVPTDVFAVSIFRLFERL
jgi:hypothetical protein